MNADIKAYNNNLEFSDKDICNLLAATIDNILTEADSKIWHAHPVWFLNDNPTVGYSKQKKVYDLCFGVELILE